MRVPPMPRRRSIAAWSKPLFLPSSDCHAFVQLRSLISLPLFCKVTMPLLVPPTRRDPFSWCSREHQGVHSPAPSREGRSSAELFPGDYLVSVPCHRTRGGAI